MANAVETANIERNWRLIHFSKPRGMTMQYGSVKKMNDQVLMVVVLKKIQ